MPSRVKFHSFFARGGIYSCLHTLYLHLLNNRLSSIRPWKLNSIKISTKLHNKVHKDDSPPLLLVNTHGCINRVDRYNLAVYPNGSKSVDGYCFAATDIPNLSYQFCLRITNHVSFMICELMDIMFAFHWILSIGFYLVIIFY